MAAETLGPMLAITFASRVLKKSCANFFMDNLSGLCSLVKGGSRRRDLSALACGVWLGMHFHDIRGWFDYVESESNIADGGSRDGVVDKLAQAYHVRLAPIANFSLPPSFPATTPDQWFEWWEAVSQ